MPLLDLTEDEHAELVRLVRQAIEDDRLFLAPRAKRLRTILSKLDPASIERAATPYPPPKRPRQPSVIIAKLRGSAAALGFRAARLAEGRTLVF
jgi:hypothetical protein